MAVALYTKLDAMATTLKNWKVVSPVAQQLDKIETYFNKVIFIESERENIGLSNTNSYILIVIAICDCRSRKMWM